MNYMLQTKILRTIGYAIGSIEGVLANNVPLSLAAKLENVRTHLTNELDEIIIKMHKEIDDGN